MCSPFLHVTVSQSNFTLPLIKLILSFGCSTALNVAESGLDVRSSSIEHAKERRKSQSAVDRLTCSRRGEQHVQFLYLKVEIPTQLCRTVYYSVWKLTQKASISSVSKPDCLIDSVAGTISSKIWIMYRGSEVIAARKRGPSDCDDDGDQRLLSFGVQMSHTDGQTMICAV